MKTQNTFEVKLKRSGRPRVIPKKVLRYTKIPIKGNYTFQANLWIADTPYSHFFPTVNLTLQHNGDTLRFCFKDVPELIIAIEELRRFVGELSVTLHEKHCEAVKEFLDYHEEEKLPPLNDYTVHTVIQEKLKEKGKVRRMVCNVQTGEIVQERIEDEPVEQPGGG